MISLTLARELKRAGLRWQPQAGDSFYIPDRDLDSSIFYITSMAIRVEILQGSPAITFQGAYEWALDYILLHEVVWLPRESQLRDAIEARLTRAQPPTLRLTSTPGGYVCEIAHHGSYATFAGDDASTAYGQALLHLLVHPEGKQD